MVLKKDKKKVVGERFDDDRIKSFLTHSPPENVNRDFHLLEKAYRGMIPENFATFITFFVEAGHDINATNPEGKSVAQLVKSHHHGDEYLTALTNAGAHE